MRVRLTMPAGWWSADAGTTITRRPLDAPGPTLSLTVHDVSRVVTDACPREGSFVQVGPTIEDLMTALSNMSGSQPGPTEVIWSSGQEVRAYPLRLVPGAGGTPHLGERHGPGPARS
jgi:hypothetical protein